MIVFKTPNIMQKAIFLLKKLFLLVCSKTLYKKKYNKI